MSYIHPVTHLRRSALHRRGWTDSLIRKLLTVPDVVTTSAFGDCQSLWLWSVARVEEAEKSGEYRQLVLAANTKKVAAIDIHLARLRHELPQCVPGKKNFRRKQNEIFQLQAERRKIEVAA